MSEPTERCWKLSTGSDLRWASFDSEEVAYNTGSGDTHVFDPMTALILKRLHDAPATTTELADFVASQLLSERADDLPRCVQDALVGLQKLSLVDPVSA